MNCPYCNKEMHAGYLQGSGSMMWSPRKKHLFISATKDDEFYVSDGGCFGGTANSYYCPNCKKLIVDVADSGYEVVETEGE